MTALLSKQAPRGLRLRSVFLIMRSPSVCQARCPATRQTVLPAGDRTGALSICWSL